MPKSILLVDDTETILIFEQMMLRGTGYVLHVARSGQEAIDKAKTCMPNLILLDVVMPGMDGIETCRRLKNDPATRHIPVVMVTIRGSPDVMEQACQAGCNGYLTKPVSKIALLEKVSQYLAQAAPPH